METMPRFALTTVVAVAVFGTLCSAQIGDRREPGLSENALWYGKNGRAIRGVFVKEEAGVISVYNWDTKLKDRERSPNKEAPREHVEIKLDPTNEIPDWMKRDQVRFVLDPMQ